MSDAAQIEDGILGACKTIRKCWPRLVAGIRGVSTGPASAETITALDKLVSLRYDVQLVLNGWCRVVIEDRPVTSAKAMPLGTDVLGMVEFMERHARWMSGHEAARDCLDELADRARRVRAVADPPVRDWVYLGDCPFVVEDWFCHGQVRAYPTREGVDPSCTDCGQEAVVEWWMDVLAVVPTVTHEGLRAFLRTETGRDYSRSAIRMWVNRGMIAPSGVDAQGRTLYDKGAVLYALSRRESA